MLDYASCQQQMDTCIMHVTVYVCERNALQSMLLLINTKIDKITTCITIRRIFKRFAIYVWCILL